MSEEYDYWLFKYLWLVVILPKELQFVTLGALAAYLFYKSKMRINFKENISKFVLIYVAIHLVSIAVNFPHVNSIGRLAAALNTALIWAIGVLFYQYYRTKKIDWSVCAYHLYLDLVILLGLNVVMILLAQTGLTHLSIIGRELYIDDWLNGNHIYRLQAFLEYSNLIPMMFFIAFPFAYRHFKDRYRDIRIEIATAVLLFLPVFFSNSRTGILLGGCMVLWVVYENLEKKSKVISRFVNSNIEKVRSVYHDNRRLTAIVAVVAALVLVLVLIVGAPKIYDFVMGFVNGRSGSSNTRFLIYKTSIIKAFNDNFLIGSGIKTMIGDYPLGSHSSYIGFFYKTGLLGLAVIMVALIKMAKGIFDRYFKQNMLILMSVASLFLAMVFEDIDGADWLLVLFMAVMGIYLCNSSTKDAQKSHN